LRQDEIITSPSVPTSSTGGWCGKDLDSSGLQLFRKLNIVEDGF
jgi:hypothetical protein